MDTFRKTILKIIFAVILASQGFYCASWPGLVFGYFTTAGDDEGAGMGAALFALAGLGGGGPAAEPKISIDDPVDVVEGNSGSNPVSFTVTLNKSYSKSVSVDYATDDSNTLAAADPASQPSDYISIPVTTLTFLPGETSKTVDLTVNGDSDEENNETAAILLSNPVNASLAKDNGKVVILNDDTTPIIEFNAVTGSLAENSGNASILVNITPAPTSNITLQYSVAPSGSTPAAVTADYSDPGSGSVTVTAGSSTFNLPVTIVGDTRTENDEEFTVTLLSGSGYNLGGNTAHAHTIINDDADPAITINDVTVTEGTGVSATFTVTLDHASDWPVTVNYATSDGTASAAKGDYTAVGSTILTFNPGDLTKTITITVNNDAKNENAETFNVNLSGPGTTRTGGSVSLPDNLGVGTINDDGDTAPTISIADKSVNEGNSGKTAATFTVTLSKASGKTVTVNYATAQNSPVSAQATAVCPGTPVITEDYETKSGTLSFSEDVTSLTFDVNVCGDTLVDGANETYLVNLSGAANAAISDSQALGTIVDDESSVVQFSLLSSSVTEGTLTHTVQVEVNNTTHPDLTVALAFGNDSDSATDNASPSGVDYTAVASVVIPNGQSTATFNVSINNDSIDEHDEVFLIGIGTGADYVVGGNSTHTVTIVDNDVPKADFSLATGTASNAAEDTAGTRTLNFDISPAPVDPITISYTYGGTATGADYTNTTTSVSVLAGATTGSISLPITFDQIDEADETVSVTFVDGTGYAAGTTRPTHTFTINDDDAWGYTVSAVDYPSIPENGTISATYSVVLNSQPDGNVVVGFSVNKPLQASVDVTSHTFNASNWDTPVSVHITGIPENIDDGNDLVTSTVAFTSATDTTGYAGSSATIATRSTTVLDDDTAGFSIPSASVSMTEGGTGTFTVKLTSEPTGNVVIDVANPASGDAAVDKTQLTFTTVNWNSFQTVTVTAVDDLYDETSPEAVTVALTVNTGSTLDATYDALNPSDITVNITDNDTAGYTVTPTSLNLVEGGAGASFTVRPTSNPESGETITITLTPTAEYNIDVGSGQVSSPSTATFTFTYSGSPSTLPAAKTVTVYALDDGTANSGKSRNITVSDDSGTTANGYGSGLTNPVVTANITESGSPGVTVSPLIVSATEGGATASFTVVLDKQPNGNVVVALASADTAQISIDKTSLTFTTANWNAAQTVTVTAVNDVLADGNVDVNIAITINTGSTADTTGYASLNPADVTATAVDNDSPVTISAAETLDADCDGRIDHYKITFSGSVNDSTFPGYALNSIGTATTNWIVSGYSNVRLVHGSAVATDFSSYCQSIPSDTANDGVIYIKFNEGAAFDGGAKPDLTTTAAPGLTSSSGTEITQVFTASVAESDKVKPLVVNAYADSASTSLTVVFSEAVYGAAGAQACGAGGNIVALSVSYTDGNASGATAVNSVGSDTCASDTGLNATFTMNAAFIAGDGDGVSPDDSVKGWTSLYDASSNTGDGTAALNVSVTAGPRINSATIYDSNNNGKIDQIKLVFNKNMKDVSLWNKAAQFVFGGTALVTVDSISYSAGGVGGGTITTPNDDPGVSNDTVVTLFTNDATVLGTAVKALSYTASLNTWEENAAGIDLQTIADLSSLTIDKAPPVILTAVAYDNVNSIAGVDNDDTLVITFSEPTNKFAVTAGNINSVFTLTGGHVWGSIQSATWNAAGDQLTILFGTGATVAVSDTITILSSIKDNAAVPNEALNIAAVQPISGSFFTDIVKPYMLTVTNITPTSVTIKFSESMLTDGTANAINTIANFKLDEAVAGTCATTADTNIPIVSALVVAPDTVEFALAGGQILCDVNYKISLAAGKTVVDFPGNNTLGTPNSLTFLGNERIKILSASSVDVYTVRVMFSKIPLSGTNVAGSAGCSGAVECAKRYKITPSLGDITSATIGTGALANTVTLTHTLQQAGSAYTVIGANNLDGDNFNNAVGTGGWGAIKSFDGTQELKPYPDDRASFIGKGVTLESFGSGAFYSDPFADGTTFAWAFTYSGMIYLGTNDQNNAAFRFEPDGANAVTTTFAFVTPGATCSTSVGFGTALNDCAGGTQGPNGEVGVGGFTNVTFTIGGTNYESLFAGPIKPGIGKAYYTQDVDTKLDWKEFPIYNTVGNNSESIHTIYGFDNHLIICLTTSHNSAAPICGHYTVTVNSGVLSIGSGTEMNAGKVAGIGKADGNGAAYAGIDSMIYFNNRLYIANNGGVKYAQETSTAGCSTTIAGFLKFAETSGTDDVCNSIPSAANWSNNGVPIYTKAISSLGKVRPGEKGIAKFLAFNGRLYMARNVTSTVNSTVIDHGELWVCVPGADLACDPGDWTRLISGKETQLPSVNSISMLQDNGSGYLYVGFDDNTTPSPTGVKIFRYAGTAPAASNGTDITTGGWVQQANAGIIGDPVHLYIFSSASAHNYKDGKDYVYITTADSQQAIRVFRQVDVP